MTAKNNRPAGSRTVDISWGDYSHSTARRRPVQFNGPAIMSIATYMSWEIRQFRLENETPGLFGYFNDMEAAK